MKLSEKIILLRQRCGWSQEELAERMDVSRQSVSKWENGSSVPELDRVVRLCALFEVSADLLINDALELSDAPSAGQDDRQPLLTADEVYAYFSTRQVAAQKLSLAVGACVASPAPAVLFGAPGVCLLLAMIAWAVWQFIAVGELNKPYRRVHSLIRSGQYRTTPEVREWLRSNKTQTHARRVRRISAGVALTILSPVPVIAMPNELGAALLLVLAAVAVSLFIS